VNSAFLPRFKKPAQGPVTASVSAMSQPKQETFKAAARVAVENPVDTPIERLRQCKPPIRFQMQYIDVVAAIGNVTGNSNRIKVRGPAMLVIDGLVNDPGASPVFDVGGIEIWVTTGNGPQGEFAKIPNVGPYFYLPEAGEYWVRGYLLTNPIAGAIILPTVYFNCTLYEGIDPIFASALLSTTRTSWTQHQGTSVGVAAVQALRPPNAAGIHDAPSTNTPPYGNLAHCKAVTISNSGTANPVSIGVNNSAINAIGGVVLAPAQNVRFEVGGIFTLYAFSTLGTNVVAVFEFI
jgi:hypothetical protein